MRVKTDYLRLTIPLRQSAGFFDDLFGFLLPASPMVEFEGFLRFPLGGTAKVKPFSRVLSVSFSGQALGEIRAASLYEGLLSLLFEWGAKVTLIDAALDTDEDAPLVISDVYARCKTGQVKLTRKEISKYNVFQGVDQFGRDTGTLYLGARTAEVRMRVYDKRQELLDKGHDDQGTWTRYELTVTDKQNITLRDAHDPTALFWHFAGRSLLECPASVPEWVGHAENFKLPSIDPILPYQRLKTYLDNDAHLRAIARLAASCGSTGERLLLDAVRDMVHASREAPESTDEAQQG